MNLLVYILKAVDLLCNSLFGIFPFPVGKLGARISNEANARTRLLLKGAFYGVLGHKGQKSKKLNKPYIVECTLK